MKNVSPSLEFQPSIATFFKKVNKDWLNIRTDNRFNNKLSNPIILANKQPLTLQQLPTRSKNNFLQFNQPCHNPRCKVCSLYDTKSGIEFDNDVTISAAKADSDSQIVVYVLFCASTLFLLEKLPTVLGFDLAIASTALSTIYLLTP